MSEYFGHSITWVDSSVNKRMAPRVNLTSLALVGLPASVGPSKISRFNANVAYHDDYVAVSSGKNISMRVCLQFRQLWKIKYYPNVFLIHITIAGESG